MSYTDRFSVSLDTELLAAFDHYIGSKGYENRSEAIRDLIREKLAASRLEVDEEQAAAVITLVCDHRGGGSALRLRKALAQHANLVTASLRFPLANDRDFEAIGLKGAVDQIRALGDRIRALRGITHANLAIVPLEDEG